MTQPSPMHENVPRWYLLQGPGVRFVLNNPPVKVELSPALVQAMIEAAGVKETETDTDKEK